MLTSLKALLFPSAGPGVAPAAAASAPGAADFAALLGDVTSAGQPILPDAAVASGAAAAAAMSPPVPSYDGLSEGAPSTAQAGSPAQPAETKAHGPASGDLPPSPAPQAALSSIFGAAEEAAPRPSLPESPARPNPRADFATPRPQTPDLDERAIATALPSKEAIDPATPEDGLVPETIATATAESMRNPAPAHATPPAANHPLASDPDQPDTLTPPIEDGAPQLAALDSADDGITDPADAPAPSAAQPDAWPDAAAPVPPPAAPLSIVSTAHPLVPERAGPSRAAPVKSGSNVPAAPGPRAHERPVADDGAMATDTDAGRKPDDEDAQPAIGEGDGTKTFVPAVPGHPPVIAAADAIDSAALGTTASAAPTPAIVASIAAEPSMSPPTANPRVPFESADAPTKPLDATALVPTEATARFADQGDAPTNLLDATAPEAVATPLADPASRAPAPSNAAPQAAAPAVAAAMPPMPQGRAAIRQPDAPTAAADSLASPPQPIDPNPAAPDAPAADAAAPMPVATPVARPPAAALTEAARPAYESQTAADPEGADIAATPAPPADPGLVRPARKVVAEAVSLLQLVRDQMRGPSPRVASTDAPASPARPDQIVTPAIDAAPTADHAATPLPPATPPATPSASATLAPAAAAPVDLSAALGARIVDMGVSGQWIDGLARDIAGLSANGAQGRFQVDAGQLGPIQIDIRQGADGAAVSLTVASDLAEQALRQDSDRLKLDASLSAVRISEVKVERAALPEPARADSANNSSTQQQSGQGQQQGWQNAQQGWGQSAAQGQMPHRQPRENMPAAHKGNGDPAVLNHEQARGESADLPRARYA